MMPFNPYSLTMNAGINRVKMFSVPGLPNAWRGMLAYWIFARETLVKRICETFPDLAPLPDPIPQFETRYLAEQHPAALAIADERGTALGYLLLTLNHGDAEDRAARPEWDDSYWQHWASIKRVILGGGLMAGLLGRRVLQRAAPMLSGMVSLEIAKHAVLLPLIGQARLMDEGAKHALVFDFGGTAVKRACAIYEDHHVAALERLPDVAVPTLENGEALAAFMTGTITQSWHTVGRDLADEISISLANYVEDCRLVTDGGYGRLNELADNGCELLAERVSSELNHAIQIKLIHDGTAAAHVYAGASNTVVITMGTALGIGFPPPVRGLMPLSDDFSVQRPD